MKRLLLPLLGTLALLGAAIPHHAMAATYTCSASSPLGAINDPDTVTITDDGTGCTVASITSGASVSINTSSLTVNGPISAVGEVLVSSPGVVSLQAVTSSGSDVNISNTAGSGTPALSAGAITASTYATLDAGGALSLTGVVQTTSSNISLTAGSSIASTGNISAGGSAGIAATTTVNIPGTINTGTANSTDGGISVSAGGDIVTGALTTGGPTGNINVTANTNGGGDDLNIGSAGANGTGTLTVNAGAGSSISVSNGSATAGASNVKLNAMTAISFNLANSGNSLNLSALGGTLTLPDGTLSLDGAASQITLLAKEVDTGATTISASQTPAMAGVNHGVNVNTDTLKYSGNLTIRANGNGAACDPNTGLCPLAAVNFMNYTYSAGTSTVQFVGSNGAALDIGADGNYTQVQVMVDAISFTGGAVNIHTKGTNNNLYLQNQFVAANPTLSINNTGDFILDASGTDSDGSSLYVLVGQATLKAPNITLKANGPTSGDGASGTIYYSASATTLDPSSHGNLIANAASAGVGNSVYGDPTAFDTVAIYLDAGTVPSNLLLGTGSGQWSFSANGGANGGSAGTVQINSSLDVTIQSANAVTASALAGNGDGGWIYISNNIGSAPNNDSGSFTAVGFGTGAGGKVTAGNDSGGTLDANTIFTVNAGPSNTAFDGSVTLNNVTCQQFPVGSAWPTTYWNCVIPASPTSLDQAPAEMATSLTDAARSRFGTNNVALYVFPQASGLDSFSNTSGNPNEAGHTYKFGNTIYVNVFETYTDSLGTQHTLTQPQALEATGHELGHALGNYILFTEPTSETYINTVLRDFINLDLYSIGGSSATSVSRPPCNNAPDGTKGPFSGVIDESTQLPFCGTGSGYDPTSGIESKYLTSSGVPHSNSYIFQAGAAYIMQGNPTTGYPELYPQSFAMATVVKGESPSSYLSYASDGVIVQNNNFACTIYWAQQLANAATTPPTVPYDSCNTAVPSWYLSQVYGQ